MPPSRAAYAHPQPTSYPEWESRPCTEADCRWLAPRLTAGAIDEIAATSRFQPISALLQDLTNKRVIVDNRRPHQPDALLYLYPNPDDPEEAGVWLALTEKLAQSEHLWSFVTYLSPLVDHLNTLYPKLLCAVDARNVSHAGLLEQLDFRLSNTLPQYGRKELPFHFYTRSNSNL